MLRLALLAAVGLTHLSTRALIVAPGGHANSGGQSFLFLVSTSAIVVAIAAYEVGAQSHWFGALPA
jgi:hypothetical protein